MSENIFNLPSGKVQNEAKIALQQIANTIGTSIDTVSRMHNVEELVSSVIDGDIQGVLNNELVATDIENKLNAKEAEYAPKLTKVTKQVAQTNEDVFQRNQYVTRRPMITIDTDDGKIEDYTVLYPFLKERGIVGTVSIPPSKIGQNGRMSWNQIQELVDEGWSVSSHTLDEVILTDHALDEVDYQLRESKRIIEEQGFTCDYLTYPTGAYDDDVMKIAKKYYKAAGSIASGIQDKVVHSADLRRVAIERIDIETIKGYIDEAVETNGWLILYTHGDVFANTPLFQERLDLAIQYAKGLGVEFANHDDAWKVHGNLIDLGTRSHGYWREEHFAMSYSGDVVKNGSNVPGIVNKQFIDFNTINDDETNFKTGVLTYTAVGGNDSLEFPEAKPGILITDTLNPFQGYVRQFYFIHRENVVYSRVLNLTSGSNEWTDFEVVMQPRTSIMRTTAMTENVDFSTPITEFEIGTVTHDMVQDERFPGNTKVGILTTKRFNEWEGYNYQEFNPHNTNIVYKRMWLKEGSNDGYWSEFEVVMQPRTSVMRTFGVTKNVDFSTPITDFELGTVTRDMVSDELLFPGNTKVGILTTKRFNEWGGYNYQEFNPHNTDLVYKRTWLSDGSWTDFKLMPHSQPESFTTALAGSTSLEIVFVDKHIQPDNNYGVLATPNWRAGDVWITNPTTNGFTINWETAPSVNNSIAYKIVRNNNY